MAKQFLFELGALVATPGALDALRENQAVSMDLIYRHAIGDWGTLSKSDQQANERALKDGSRIFSAYLLKDETKVWVITEAVGDDGKRGSTCVLLPDEY